jgi:hypothetical protein
MEHVRVPVIVRVAIFLLQTEAIVNDSSVGVLAALMGQLGLSRRRQVRKKTSGSHSSTKAVRIIYPNTEMLWVTN